ncbi:hypothetical protein ACQP2F_29440 [Actinoplanes sp. CA-030573]|uniref:hypothetical protein n=1 Tax=Actinoplanes sp. CA-030573 TaxID=3239898 RepID=UPI003D8D5EC1
MTGLTAWQDEIDIVLDRLRDFELPADFRFDFSADSLDALEAELLARGNPGGDFLESATAYVGEAFRRAGGGEWDWDSRDDMPVLAPVGAGPAIAPLRLLSAAVREKSAHVLREALERWAAAGEAPAAEPAPAVDPWLADWLAARSAAFPSWAAETGRDAATWDFSPGSLTALEEVMAERPDFTSSFADGAVWYLGEVTRRAWGTRWNYIPGTPGPGDPWSGRPYVKVPDGNATVPIAMLKASVRRGEPGYLVGELSGYWQ